MTIISREVHAFTSGCEHLLAAAVATHQPLTEDEWRIVEYYCKELLEQLAPVGAAK